MATLSLNATSNADAVWSQNTTYATMQAGSTLALMTLSDTRVGQRLVTTTRHGYQTFMEFDTTTLSAGDTVTGVVFKVRQLGKDSTTNFVAQAYVFDYSTSVTTADWRTPANLGGYTLVAHITVAAQANGLVTMTDDAFPANINKGGYTRIVLTSDRFIAGNDPPDGEYWVVDTDNTNGTPSTLDITYTPAASVGAGMMGGGFFP